MAVIGCNGWKWLKIFRMLGIDWKWLEWFEVAGNGWKWLPNGSGTIRSPGLVHFNTVSERN